MGSMFVHIFSGWGKMYCIWENKGVGAVCDSLETILFLKKVFKHFFGNTCKTIQSWLVLSRLCSPMVIVSETMGA